MTNRAVHVLHTMIGWAVKIDGVKGLTIHSSKGQAVEAGRYEAKLNHLPLVVHDKDGSERSDDGKLAAAAGC